MNDLPQLLSIVNCPSYNTTTMVNHIYYKRFPNNSNHDNLSFANKFAKSAALTMKSTSSKADHGFESLQKWWLTRFDCRRVRRTGRRIRVVVVDVIVVVVVEVARVRLGVVRSTSALSTFRTQKVVLESVETGNRSRTGRTKRIGGSRWDLKTEKNVTK